MFIGRKPDGSIYGTWTCKQPDDAGHLGIEEVDDDNPALLAFQSAQSVMMNQPKKLANGDLAALLVTKNIITQADVDAAKK
jgi:hypothetical protein